MSVLKWFNINARQDNIYQKGCWQWVIKEIKIFGIDLLSYTLFLWEKGKGVYDKACGHICPYLNKDMNVLELVCDSGQLSFRLSKHVKRWIGTDFSEWMILEAKKA